MTELHEIFNDTGSRYDTISEEKLSRELSLYACKRTDSWWI